MFLLDTNVISEIRKVHIGSGNRGVAKWAERVKTQDFFISAVTIEEIEIGVLQMERRDAVQGIALRGWMNDYVLPTFSGHVLAFNLEVAQRSARLHVPNPRPVRDAMIAATALVHGMTVVTRNVAHFEPTGVVIFNPWTD